MMAIWSTICTNQLFSNHEEVLPVAQTELTGSAESVSRMVESLLAVADLLRLQLTIYGFVPSGKFGTGQKHKL